MQNQFLQQFRRQWASLNPAKKEGKHLLAVSGGVDSMVLADLCLKSNVNFSVAHANFRLRGIEADLDEELVRDWCEQNKIVFHSTQFETGKQALEWKKGIQETARILRYEWFAQLRKEHGYNKIVTAHHANDNIETVLINFFKGTGISGMHGIMPDSNNIQRPMLFATKDQILRYANECNVPYREDASNNSDDYLRNEVRHHIIPKITEFFPNATNNILESINRLAESEILFRKAIETERKKLVEQRGSDHYIPIKKIEKRTPLNSILYELLLPFGFSSAQLPNVLQLFHAESGHYIVSQTHRLIRNRDFLIITGLPTENTDFVLIDKIPCAVELNKCKISFQYSNKPDAIKNDPNIAYIDSKKIEPPLILRKWKTGDYFYPFGMRMKKKKISRLLIDEKVAMHEKENIWVLESNKRIVWVAGKRLDERFKINEQTEQVLFVKMVL